MQYIHVPCLYVLGGSKRVQHLFIAGHCGNMDFQMEFWLSEIKVESLPSVLVDRISASLHSWRKEPNRSTSVDPMCYFLKRNISSKFPTALESY